MSNLLKALEAKYEAEVLKAKANIDVYVRSSVGIGEHSDIVDSIDTQIQKLTEAEDKLTTLKSFYGNDINFIQNLKE